MKGFTIIAGPCSISPDNIDEAVEIGKIPEVDGVRVVGLKSVTSPRAFMGIDQEAFFDDNLRNAPSLRYADRILRETGKFVAFEMMDIRQAEAYVTAEFSGKVFVWNPAINQLGWPMYRAAVFAKSFGWQIGLKNPKWSGDPDAEVDGQILDNGEKNWLGNAKYVEKAGVKPVMIQRGIDGYNKHPFRNLPNHQASVKMKALGYQVFFDPSHVLGQHLRDHIVAETIDVAAMKVRDEYLYDGILIEVGHAATDSFQHITIPELKEIIEEVKRIRGL